MFITTKKFASFLTVKWGSPMKYLGVPVSPSRLYIEDWISLEEKNDKGLETYKGICLSMAGRISLICVCFLVPIYIICPCIFFKKPLLKFRCQEKKVSLARRGEIKKYHLVNWRKAYHSKKNGGLGIKNLEV